jgi:hydroxymethylglutaryl-CoA reductase
MTIAALHGLSLQERAELLKHHHRLTDTDVALLTAQSETLAPAVANCMIENVLGVLGLPLGIGLHLQVNGHIYAVPMAVEEPSIVAALSAVAKRVQRCGGFQVELSQSYLIGQIFIHDIHAAEQALAKLADHKPALLELGNRMQPRMVERGGGLMDIRCQVLPQYTSSPAVVLVELSVDTCDAMGANAVNTLCEQLAPEMIAILGEGRSILKILSNACRQSMVHAHCRVHVDELVSKQAKQGLQIAQDIVLANHFAMLDVNRAVTHNKGIMNGIDPIAIATGNDWRAIEAAAHAYAAHTGRYSPLTRWWLEQRLGDTWLCGGLWIPLKVGVVGGNVKINPAVALAHRLLGNPSAKTLASIMAAAGLAQNLAALRALVTTGIQHGHMRLHARSVAYSAGVPTEKVDDMVECLIRGGEIKTWKAREYMQQKATVGQGLGKLEGYVAEKKGHAKLVLLGEHAVVYGTRALAVPIPLGVYSHVEKRAGGFLVAFAREGIQAEDLDSLPLPLKKSLHFIFEHLALSPQGFALHIRNDIPHGMGLGSSAAWAVSVIRALCDYAGRDLTEKEICHLAWEVEKTAHATPSGVDNTVATYGQPVFFKGPPQVEWEVLSIAAPLYMVVGFSHQKSFTHSTVSSLRQRQQDYGKLYRSIFAEIDRLACWGKEALARGDMQEFGVLLNLNHGLLDALGMVTPEVKKMVELCRLSGALGAKMTGSGNGGAMFALCNDTRAQLHVGKALETAGYRCFEHTVLPTGCLDA